MNANHSYYHQVQMQLFCTERHYADFVASDGEYLFVKTIPYNKDFISGILPRLRTFYYNIL